MQQRNKKERKRIEKWRDLRVALATLNNFHSFYLMEGPLFLGLVCQVIVENQKSELGRSKKL
jgi:hypothetical protein